MRLKKVATAKYIKYKNFLIVHISLSTYLGLFSLLNLPYFEVWLLDNDVVFQLVLMVLSLN